jgi:Domain of unknown function (DUF2017)
MSAFSRRSQVRVKLRPYERELLQHLLAEMRVLLEAELPKIDPVTARLFPDAYETTPDQEAYQELVGDELRRDKLAALTAVGSAVAGEGSLDLKLTEDEASTWLTVINDLRLAIGTRLNVTEERMEEHIDEDDPEASALSALHWLGWVQESLLREMHA